MTPQQEYRFLQKAANILGRRLTHEDREDLVQETSLRALRGEFEGTVTKRRSWLYSIMRRLVLDHWKYMHKGFRYDGVPIHAIARAGGNNEESETTIFEIPCPAAQYHTVLLRELVRDAPARLVKSGMVPKGRPGPKVDGQSAPKRERTRSGEQLYEARKKYREDYAP